MKTYHLRTDGECIEIIFRPGEWAQACAFFTTTDSVQGRRVLLVDDLRETDNKALAIATEGLPAHIVLCVNAHDTLIAACREALDCFESHGHLTREFTVAALRAAIAAAEGKP